jgi:hypothetical protein
MQPRFRTFAPAAAAALVHVLLFLGLMSLGRFAPPDDVPAALPITWIPRAPEPAAGPVAPGFGLKIAPPAINLPSFTMPVVPTLPADEGLSILGGYIACGLGQELTAEDRERCEKQRREFYAGPGPADGPTAADLALEKRFARDKAVQDAPILLPCFTPAGPSLFCLLGGVLNGFEFATGSYAGTGRPENPLAEPVHPYRPR